MFHSVTEIAEEGLYLSHFRGFLKVSKGSEEKGRVPLDDVAVLMVTARGATLSKDLLLDLAEHDAITVLCDHHFHPAAMVLPYGQHSESGGRMKDQIKATQPLCKNLWKTLVRQKLINQAAVLRLQGDEAGAKMLHGFSGKVKSGDADNREAVGAQYYWPRLVGKTFKRNDDTQAVNALFNYGYAVLRGASARAVTAAGLLPAWGLGHTNRGNAFCLADDLMEPFRPVVDAVVVELAAKKDTEMNPQIKRRLAMALQQDVKGPRGQTPVAVALLEAAQSLAASFAKKKNLLLLPELCLP